MSNKLLSELKKLDDQIKVYNLSDEDRRKERVVLLNNYNRVKDGALKSLSGIANIQGKSLARVLKEKSIDFDKSS